MSRLKERLPAKPPAPKPSAAKPAAAAKTSARADQVLRDTGGGGAAGIGARAEQGAFNRPVRDGQLRPGPGEEDRFLTVTELARELGVTARALRLYEDKNLITPRRVANTRVYTHRERARMILILRGKRLGFSLREIKDYLDLYDADPVHLTQTRVLLKKIAVRSQQLEDQRLAVDQALKGLKELERDALASLEKAELEIRAGRIPLPNLELETRRPQDTSMLSAAASAADHEEPLL